MHPHNDIEADSGAHEPGQKLLRLVEDPLYWREQDPEFRAYVDNGFKTVYGNEEAEKDATGRMIDPAPKAVALPQFRPSVQPDDVSLAGGVGENQPNRWRDVWTVQKGLANTGHYPLDLTQEKSGEHTPTLAKAIRDFQREKREEIDGVLLPDGPTIKRLGESLVGATPSVLNSDERFGSQTIPIAAAGPLTGVLGTLLSPPSKAAAPETPQITPQPGAESETITPTQAPGQGDLRRPRTHREAEDRSMERMVPYHVIDLPDRTPNRVRSGRILHVEADRRESIIANTPGRIVVKEDPRRRGAEPMYSIHAAGRAAVENFDKIIRQEAARAGVDPNLVRAIMYVENAHGQYGKPLEGIGIAKSILPMNIRYDIWGRLGFSRSDFFDATSNIRAGAMLIRRIQDRVEDPTVSKVATLYNGLGKDAVTEFGARVAEVYRTRAWERKDDTR